MHHDDKVAFNFLRRRGRRRLGRNSNRSAARRSIILRPMQKLSKDLQREERMPAAVIS